MSQKASQPTGFADGTVPLSNSPVFASPNKLKLGIFGINLAGSVSGMSTLPCTVRIANWDEQKRLAITADRAGFEALVPATRWKGFNSPSGYWDRSYDTWTWGGAMAAITERIGIFTTAMVRVYHPVMAAKMGATLDHISGGRWAINIVPGWFGEEFEMFGLEMGDRKARYRMAAEWTMLVKRLWTETEPFDYEGEFFSLKGAISAPKPVQSPRPLLMNAGQSEEGLDFAVNNVDMIFVTLTDEEKLKANIATVKDKGAKLGKQMSVWSTLDVICQSTEQEARDFAESWMEAADDVAVDRFLGLMAGGDAGTHKDLLANPEIRRTMALGGGAPTLIGTPETLVEKLQHLSDLGMDGLVLTWHQYPEGLDQFVSDVMPVMVDAGLRAE